MVQIIFLIIDYLEENLHWRFGFQINRFWPMISRLASMSVFSYPSLRWGTFACIKAAGQGYHPFRRKSWERKFSAIGPIRIARAINRIAPKLLNPNRRRAAAAQAQEGKSLPGPIPSNGLKLTTLALQRFFLFYIF